MYVDAVSCLHIVYVDGQTDIQLWDIQLSDIQLPDVQLFGHSALWDIQLFGHSAFGTFSF